MRPWRTFDLDQGGAPDSEPAWVAMTKTTKTLLGLAITGLALGLAINIGLFGALDSGVQYVVFPTGAIFLGLFLISKLLERESAQYDHDHDERLPGRVPSENRAREASEAQREAA